MNITTSRILVAIQAVLLCLPLSVLYIFTVIPATLYFIGENPIEPTYITITVNLVIILGIISAWWLMYNFVARGHTALITTALHWWVISGTMAIFATLVQLYIFAIGSYEASSLISLGWGVFFLPPYIHLLFERRRTQALTSRSSSLRLDA